MFCREISLQEQGLRGFLSDNTFYIAIALSVFIILLARVRSMLPKTRRPGGGSGFWIGHKTGGFHCRWHICDLWNFQWLWRYLFTGHPRIRPFPAYIRSDQIPVILPGSDWPFYRCSRLFFCPGNFKWALWKTCRNLTWKGDLDVSVTRWSSTYLLSRSLFGASSYWVPACMPIPMFYRSPALRSWDTELCSHSLVGFGGHQHDHYWKPSRWVRWWATISPRRSCWGKEFPPRRDGEPREPSCRYAGSASCSIITLAFVYDKLVAQHFSLVSVGLISFAGSGPICTIGDRGIYWKHASQRSDGGHCRGFVIWFYAAVVPSHGHAHVPCSSRKRVVLVYPGLGQHRSLACGAWIRSPLFFWSMLFNIITFIAVSLNSNKTVQETYQAELFVGIFRHSAVTESMLSGRARHRYRPEQFYYQFPRTGKAEKLISHYAQRHKIPMDQKKADARLVTFAERVLSGVIGSASGIMVGTVTKEEKYASMRCADPAGIATNDRAQQKLRRKSSELQKATEQLTQANEQLNGNGPGQKDEFLYTVTHELRTPLTSIRAMAGSYTITQTCPMKRRCNLSGVIREQKAEPPDHAGAEPGKICKGRTSEIEISLRCKWMNCWDTIRSVEHLARRKSGHHPCNWPGFRCSWYNAMQHWYNR